MLLADGTEAVIGQRIFYWSRNSGDYGVITGIDPDPKRILSLEVELDDGRVLNMTPDALTAG